jgi:chloramphenicol-sensitive protein RarD
LNKGILYAAAAYIIWGLLPLYWKALQGVPALEILAHRIVWSLIFVSVILTVRHKWSFVKPALRDRRIVLTFVASGLLLSVNWFTYIWAVNDGHIVETSLGYFINPLVNVLLGYVVLKERMRPAQWAAIALAAAGVLYLTLSYGSFPWIALTLAFSFGTYGLLRKTAKLNSAEGLAMETAVLFLPAAGYLLLLQSQGAGSFAGGDLSTTLLLFFAGAATSIPLLFFAAGARLIPLASLGLLQYIAPTLQFLIGVLVYDEPFGISRLIGFSIIWLALILYSAEGLAHYRRRLAPAEAQA